MIIGFSANILVLKLLGEVESVLAIDAGTRPGLSYVGALAKGTVNLCLHLRQYQTLTCSASPVSFFLSTVTPKFLNVSS